MLGIDAVRLAVSTTQRTHRPPSHAAALPVHSASLGIRPIAVTGPLVTLQKSAGIRVEPLHPVTRVMDANP